MTGLLAVPAAADTAPPVGPVADRVKAVAAWQAGGPAVRRAAEIALAGSDTDVTAFVTSGRQAAADQDLRTKVEELVATSGPGVREAATAALTAGTPAVWQNFLDKGYKSPYEHDQRVLLSQIQYAAAPVCRKPPTRRWPARWPTSPPSSTSASTRRGSTTTGSS
ncbi:ALF repeat-containing protein [Kitasatospora gansuensis]